MRRAEVTLPWRRNTTGVRLLAARALAMALYGCSGRSELASESIPHGSAEDPDAGRSPVSAMGDGSGEGSDDASTMTASADSSLNGADSALIDSSGVRDSGAPPAPNCSNWGTSTTALSVGRSGFVATGFDDGSATIRDPSLGLLREITAHQGPVQGIGLSDDGTLLVTLGDGEIRLWTVPNGQIVGGIGYSGPTTITRMVISRDNQSLILLGGSQIDRSGSPFRTAYDWTFTVFDLNIKASLWNSPKDVFSIESAFFCGPDQDVCVATSYDFATYRRADGKPLRSVSGASGVPSPDGTMLVKARAELNDVLDVTRTADGTTSPVPFDDAGFSRVLVFSIDGSVLTSLTTFGDVGNDGWDLPSFTALEPWNWTGPSLQAVPMWSLGSGPGANLMVDDFAGRLAVLDARTGHVGPVVPTLGQQNVPEVVRFSPDGSLVATLASFSLTGNSFTDSGSLVIWDTVTHTSLWSLSGVTMQPGKLHAVAFSPDGQLVFVHDSDGARVLGARDGHLVRSLESGGVCFAPSPDGSILYACGQGTASGYPIEVYDMVLGTQRTMDGNFASTDLAVSPLGTSLVVTFVADKPGDHLGLRMYPLPDGPRGWEADTGDAEPTTSMVFSPDGKILALTKPRAPGLHLFDTETGKGIDVLEPDEALGPVAFSPDGRFLAAGTSHGIDLLRVADRKVIKTLLPAVKAPVGVAFSPGGDQLLVGSGNGRISSICKALDGL